MMSESKNTRDPIACPSHYAGTYGMECIDAIRNMLSPEPGISLCGLLVAISILSCECVLGKFLTIVVNHVREDVVSFSPKNFDMGSKPETVIFIQCLYRSDTFPALKVGQNIGSLSPVSGGGGDLSGFGETVPPASTIAPLSLIL